MRSASNAAGEDLDAWLSASDAAPSSDPGRTPRRASWDNSSAAALSDGYEPASASGRDGGGGGYGGYGGGGGGDALRGREAELRLLREQLALLSGEIVERDMEVARLRAARAAALAEGDAGAAGESEVRLQVLAADRRVLQEALAAKEGAAAAAGAALEAMRASLAATHRLNEALVEENHALRAALAGGGGPAALDGSPVAGVVKSAAAPAAPAPAAGRRGNSREEEEAEEGEEAFAAPPELQAATSPHLPAPSPHPPAPHSDAPDAGGGGGGGEPARRSRSADRGRRLSRLDSFTLPGGGRAGASASPLPRRPRSGSPRYARDTLSSAARRKPVVLVSHAVALRVALPGSPDDGTRELLTDGDVSITPGTASARRAAAGAHRLSSDGDEADGGDASDYEDFATDDGASSAGAGGGLASARSGATAHVAGGGGGATASPGPHAPADFEAVSLDPGAAQHALAGQAAEIGRLRGALGAAQAALRERERQLSASRAALRRAADEEAAAGRQLREAARENTALRGELGAAAPPASPGPALEAAAGGPLPDLGALGAAELESLLARLSAAAARVSLALTLRNDEELLLQRGELRSPLRAASASEYTDCWEAPAEGGGGGGTPLSDARAGSPDDALFASPLGATAIA